MLYPVTNDTMKLLGPYRTTIEVHVTNEVTHGKITIDLTLGNVPTQADIDEALKKAYEYAGDNGMRPMNKEEFFNFVLQEKTGLNEKFAVPGGREWDK